MKRLIGFSGWIGAAGFPLAVCAVLVLIRACGVACADETAADENGSVSNLPFSISWPLTAAAERKDSSRLPLLRGTIHTRLAESGSAQETLKIRVSLERPDSEEQRGFWNSTLAYPQYSWMSAVRVWDKDQRWLWPNLPYLLCPFGTQGFDRYGGWDPGKHVDNDFAAVLIRKYDYAGVAESDVTRTNPLVSAEWRAEGIDDGDAYTVIHKAKSDEFVVTLGRRETSASGQVRVWLIYGDFLHSQVPRGWPKEPEFSGGILAFFKVLWQNDPASGCRFTVLDDVPPGGTRFDWRAWINRPTADRPVEATPRLSD